MPGVENYDWIINPEDLYENLENYAPQEFAEDLFEQAEKIMEKEARKTNRTELEYKTSIGFTDCKAGFNEATEAYAAHTRHTHGVNLRSINKLEDKQERVFNSRDRLQVWPSFLRTRAMQLAQRK